jgi:hypothetical protein
MSVAAYKALFQLFSKPSYWEKTEHGHCRFDDAEPFVLVAGPTLVTQPSTT